MVTNVDDLAKRGKLQNVLDSLDSVPQGTGDPSFRILSAIMKKRATIVP